MKNLSLLGNLRLRFQLDFEKTLDQIRNEEKRKFAYVVPINRIQSVNLRTYSSFQNLCTTDVVQT